MLMNYNQMFGSEWANKLQQYLLTGDLQYIARSINQDRKIKRVIPDEGSPLFFKIFKDLQPSDIKIVVLGQDLYPTLGAYDGYTFSCSNTLRPQPSLKNIIEEIEYEYPDNLQMDRCDLSYLVKQGVFLVNTAHSVIENLPGSHIHLYVKFTRACLDVLQDYNDIGYLLMGNHAQSYADYIVNPSHFIVSTSHPAPLGYKKTTAPFYHSGCFKQINKELLLRNKKEIIW